MRKYWDQGISFEDYYKTAEQRLAEPRNEEDLENKHYYELGIQRMNRALKTFNITDEQNKTFEAKHFKGHILIISETWCGDASAIVPVLVKFFEGKVPVRIFLRDDDQSLINQFLTNGGMAIPKVLILDENFEVKQTWGPRSAYGTALLQKFKENQDTYSKEDFYNELQVYYAKNKGVDVLKEILELF